MTKTALLSAKQAAEMLNVPRTRIKQLESEGSLVTINEGGKAHVPAGFLVEVDGQWEVLESLRGTVTLLRDAGFSSAEMVEWLFAVEDELGCAPIDSLRVGSARQVNRIAQTLGY